MGNGLASPPKHPALSLGAYYGTLALGFYALSVWFPGLIELATATAPAVVDLQDAFGPVAQPPAAGGLASMIPLGASLLAALALSLPVSWTYMGARSSRGFDASVVQTIVILPIAVVGITSIVQHNIALAFSLAGIAAGVRFRNALKDTSDALYIFAAIGVGLATGTGQIATAFLVSAFFNLANLLFWNPEAVKVRPEEGKVLAAVQGPKSRRKATRMVAKTTERDGAAASSEPPYEPTRRSTGS